MSRILIERLVLRAPIDAESVPWIRARIERELARAMAAGAVRPKQGPVPPTHHPSFPAEVAQNIRTVIATHSNEGGAKK